MVIEASTRETAGKTLVELGRAYENLVVVGGDLNASTFANLFGDEFPDRFFDFGPAEQNMVSVAAGLASSGKIPVVSTFAVFGTSRPYDQLRVGVSQPKLNVKVIVTHSGILTGEDGVSAQSIEDLALMCALPEFTVIVPADAIETEQVIRAAVETEGPFYVRLSRPPTPLVHDSYFKFMTGKSEMMMEGKDVTIIACGFMVAASIEAASRLNDEGISCRVINMSTLSPIDEESIIAAASETGAIVTAEEHFVIGGLGSLVSGVLARSKPSPVENVALRGYAESGDPDDLLHKYNLTAGDIEKAVRRVKKRKLPQ